jgi:hypothetical protein
MDITPPLNGCPQTGEQHIPFLMVFARRVNANFSRPRPTDVGMRPEAATAFRRSAACDRTNECHAIQLEGTMNCAHTARCHLPEHLREPFGVICCVAPIVLWNAGVSTLFTSARTGAPDFPDIDVFTIVLTTKKIACTNIARLRLDKNPL